MAPLYLCCEQPLTLEDYDIMGTTDELHDGAKVRFNTCHCLCIDGFAVSGALSGAIQ